MKIVLLVTGKTEMSFWKDALEEYCRRLTHYVSFAVETIPDIRNAKSYSETQLKEHEGLLILKALQTGDACILLDEKGREYTSADFASWLEKKMLASPKRLVFIVGGAYGFSDAVYKAVTERISMSLMTFSHQMIRPVFAEQLYRAMTILHNEPYHHK